MIILFIVLGAIFIAGGLYAFLRPGSVRQTEQRVSPAWLESTIPAYWNGHMNSRSRFVGAMLVGIGVLILIFGIVGR